MSAKKAKVSHGDYVTLRNGTKMPLKGLGTWLSKPGQVESAVEHAISTVGYRHIDCAHVYQNEAEVGAGLKAALDKDKSLTRDDIFITSKLWNVFHAPDKVESACRETLKNLNIDQLDLYLIHWPTAFANENDALFPKKEDGSMVWDETQDLVKTWHAFERLVDLGLTKEIGVSNFNAEQLKRVTEGAKKHKPSMLQVESHPYLNQRELIAAAKALGVEMTSYSPIGSPSRPWADSKEPVLLEDETVSKIASELHVEPAQVLIRFNIQRGLCCIPKSVTPSRIESNFAVDFTLSEEHMSQLMALEETRFFRYCCPCIMVNGKRVPRDDGHKEFPFARY